MTPRTLAAWNGTGAGYHAVGWPAAILQPPAATSCPGGPVIQNGHQLPAPVPVTWASIAVLCCPNTRSSG